MEKIVLREADINDVAFINEMMFHSLASCGYTKAELNKIMHLYKLDAEYMSHYKTYLAFSCEVPIGFFSFVKKADYTYELDYFIIHKNSAGRGYGRIMWKECCDKAKVLKINSFIIMSTPYAEGFYQKMGAKKVGECLSEIREGIALPLLEYVITPRSFLGLN